MRIALLNFSGAVKSDSSQPRVITSRRGRRSDKSPRLSFQIARSESVLTKFSSQPHKSHWSGSEKKYCGRFGAGTYSDIVESYGFIAKEILTSDLSGGQCVQKKGADTEKVSQSNKKAHRLLFIIA